MSTYFLVTTVDADDPNDAIAIARSMDAPSAVPTIGELRARIGAALVQYSADARDAGDFGARLDVTHNYVSRIVEIVTLGNVPA